LFLHPQRLQDQRTYDIAYNLVHGNSGLSKDRSIVASTALHMGFDKLFFIDADQSWRFEDFARLVHSPHKIVGAPIAQKKRPISLNFTPLERDNDCFKDSNGVPTPKGLQKLMEKYPKKEIEVALLGTGFMCVDVSVLSDLTATAPQFDYIHPQTGQKMTCWEFFPSGAADGIYWGEDWALCRNAKHAGHSIFINPYCNGVGHHGDDSFFVGDEL